jgi:hypothetical protein
MYRRIAVLASLAVVAAMFVGSSTASASDRAGESFTCVFDGLAGGLSPQIESIQDDIGSPPNPIGALDIERGSYGFGGNAICGGKVGSTVFAPIPNPTPTNPTAGLQNVTIRSNGFYDNIICSTGMAHDQTGAATFVTVTSPGLVVDVGTIPPEIGATPPGPITDIGYEIPFVGGNGPLLIGMPSPLNNLSAAGAGSGGHHPHPGVGGAWVGAGFVHIQPSAGNCVTTHVGAFDVAGAFTAHGKHGPH